MSNKQLLAQQSHIAALNDEQLLHLLGSLWESIKGLDEAMRADPEVEHMETALKEYKASNYTDAIKAYKAQLKATRALAKTRGLKFEVPEI